MNKFVWQRAVLSENGPSAPTTKLVLIGLSLYMDKDGGSCFPSTRKLARDTGLSQRSVCTHLEKAASDRWIEKHEKSGKGQAWKRYAYKAKIPDEVSKKVCKESTDKQHLGWRDFTREDLLSNE